MTALLFGSISTLADTSELQRGAFNDAFRQHGLDWNWESVPYQDLLKSNGGRKRIAEEAERLGVEVDAAAVHETKSERFREMLKGVQMTPRPGVADTIREAKARGWKVALVTTTSAENVDAIFDATTGRIKREDFDLVLDVSSVDEPKPAPAVYELALERLGESAETVMAIEDNIGGVASAKGAGVPVIAFPNENTVNHDFGDTQCVYTLALTDMVTPSSAHSA